jgi:hypothetical protein
MAAGRLQLHAGIVAFDRQGQAVPDGSESALRQPISSGGHRHRGDRPDTWSSSVPRQPLVVFTMPPHPTALLILTHGNAVGPKPYQSGSASPAGQACAAAFARTTGSNSAHPLLTGTRYGVGPQRLYLIDADGKDQPPHLAREADDAGHLRALV